MRWQCKWRLSGDHLLFGGIAVGPPGLGLKNEAAPRRKQIMHSLEHGHQSLVTLVQMHPLGHAEACHHIQGSWLSRMTDGIPCLPTQHLKGQVAAVQSGRCAVNSPTGNHHTSFLVW